MISDLIFVSLIFRATFLEESSDITYRPFSFMSIYNITFLNLFLFPFTKCRSESNYLQTRAYLAHILDIAGCFRSLGYKVVNGVVEKQDQFMKRMSGLCKLYSSLLISQAVGGEANTSLNIDNAWRWLARTINLQPRPTITATMIEAVLSVCSGRLVSVYGNQTVKLLVSLQNAYMLRLRSITDLETDGGAAEKLALYLAELSESAQPTREPEGFLGRGFWYS